MNRRIKIQTALLSVAAAASTSVVLFIAGSVTNSLAVLSIAVHYLLDVFNSSVNLFSIIKAEEPIDEDHRFGHSKAEPIAGLFQAIFIGVSGLYVLYQAILRFIHPQNLDQPFWGVAATIFGTVVSLLVAKRLQTIGRQTDSIALTADSLHYSMDVWTNLGVITALLIYYFTKEVIFDPIISTMITFYILYLAYGVFHDAVNDLMDHELPDPMVKDIQSMIAGFDKRILDYHNLKTRKAGAMKFIQFHITLDRNLSFGEVDILADNLNKYIRRQIPQSDVIIHTDAR